jgi:organic hydroperoxide reductase OsmC/OhrA
MGNYIATVEWKRDATEVFTDNRYSRGHQWSFDGGVTFRASSSPHVVPRYSDPAGVDPEEAFVASLASCHMLTFLYVAAKKRFCVDHYIDIATGMMGKNANGRLFVEQVTLRPQIRFDGEKQPRIEELNAMHHAAHEECFIANSVVTQITVEAVLAT